MKNIGERISNLRKEYHLKQSDIAEKLNVSQQVVSNIERGVTAPDIDQLKTLADVFHVSLDELVGRDFVEEKSSDVERRIISYLKGMDEEGKELSLGLVCQVAQHRGSGDDKE